MLIHTDNLSRWYQRGDHQIRALENLNLRVGKGEFLAVMGPSGSGKSTLLYLLGCLDRPSAGTYRYNGRDVTHISDKALSQIRALQIGFVFQTFNLLPNLTVYENVVLPLSYGEPLAPAQIQNRVGKAIAEVGLDHRRTHFPSELSGGEMQRTAIARAMVTNPQLILADEPTGNLDRHNSREILKLIRALNTKGATIILVTHETRTADWATRTIKLQEGRLVA